MDTLFLLVFMYARKQEFLENCWKMGHINKDTKWVHLPTLLRKVIKSHLRNIFFFLQQSDIFCDTY